VPSEDAKMTLRSSPLIGLAAMRPAVMSTIDPLPWT
jgi:hypothetical protein